MKKFILAFTAIISIGMAAAFANYAMTQGAGTTFGSVIVGGFHYVQMFVCDLTTPAQCQTVSAAGAAKVDGSAVTQPVSSATLSTAANQTSQITQETASAAALGTTGDAACATDNGTCTIPALIKRTNQNVTTLNTTAGAAVPAGTNRIGYVSDDPCNNANIKVYTPVNVVTATNVIITGVAAKKKYLCGIFLYPAGTDNVAIYQATTGTSCATALVSIFGGTTTTTGFQMTAQAGFVVGTGSAAFAATTVNQTDICITTSAAVQLSGAIVTVDQ